MDAATNDGSSSVVLSERLVRTLVVVHVTELIEALLLTLHRLVRRTCRFGFECAVHSLVRAVLLRVAGTMRSIRVTNVTDPDGDPVTLTITGIAQDEPVTDGRGKGEPDASGIGTALAQVRAEHDCNGNGRVYTISFTDTDGRGGSSNDTVTTCVFHDQSGNTVCTDEGPLYDSMTF